MLQDIPSFPEAGFADLAVETSLAFHGPGICRWMCASASPPT
jgi:hypothetical protein